LVAPLRGHVPDAVPVEAQGLLVVGDLAVRARAHRVRLEEEAVAVVRERIQHDRDVVVDVEVGVAGELGRDDRLRLAVTADHSHVQGVAVEEHAGLGVLGGRGSFVGLTLQEGSDGQGLRPG
jgi:hypothetical protein